MKNAIITVGLGFGDEGKGATVDFLTRHLDAELVVRYSGGAQAGHNVELPNGQRHTFSQFGAGTFAGAKTYHGPRMIVCPATLGPEAMHLKKLGVSQPLSWLTIHPDCLLATRYHMAMNRLREIDRGNQRHGSCGLGIGEARSYWLKHGGDSIRASDTINRRTLTAKLTVLRDRMLIELQKLSRIDRELAATIYETRPCEEADSILESLDTVALSEQLPEASTVIFEASQGVLLDEYFGTHPYTTWSTVTAHHALELISENAFEQVTTFGITRAYSTRHGAGPFPTYCPLLTKQINDRGNPENDWQGNLNSGPLDLVLLDYATRIGHLDGIVVNNLDELPCRPTICRSYESTERLDLPYRMRQQEELTQMLENANPKLEPIDDAGILAAIDRMAPVVLTSHGPTFEDRTIVKDILSQTPELSIARA